MKKRVVCIFLAAIFLMASTALNVFADSASVTLNSISDKKPGDTVIISGASSLGETTVKVVAPNTTTLYLNVLNGATFSDSIALPIDAATGIYTVVAGKGTTVATTTFKVTSSGGGGGGGGGGSKEIKTVPPDTGNKEINLKAILDTSTGIAKASISANDLAKAAEAATAGADGVKTIVVKLETVTGAKGEAIEFVKGMVDKTSATQNIRVETEIGILQIPNSMLNNLDNIASGETVQLEIVKADKAALPEDIKAAIGDRPIIELNLKINGSVVAWNNESAPVTVSIPYAPTAAELADPEHITVWYIDGTGKAVAVPTGKYDPATGMVTFTTTHFSKYAVVYVNKTFNDIASYSWAKKAIEVMASKGVISGTTTESFTPGSEIKRADFMLLLVKALGLSAKASGNFADVSANAYYADALATAKKLGIATGVGNNKFNPDDKISRQDMMTLIDRAMKVAKKELPAGSNADLEKYTDKSSIASYASQSVSTLIRNGIVTGDGVKVNALGNATRAETAVLIYRIYNK